MHYLLLFLLLLFTTITPCQQAQRNIAEPSVTPQPNGPAPQPTEATTPARETGVRTMQWQQSYVADAETELPNHQRDGFSVIGGSLSFQLRLPELFDATLMRGAAWRYYLFFGTRHGSPVPDELHAVYLNLGLDIKLDESWRLRLAIEPGIYSDMEDLSYHDLNAPGSLSLSYSAGRDFTIAFGLRVQPMSDIPVMPFVGLRWQFAEDWTLNMLGGGPRLEYQISGEQESLPLKIYAGLDMAGGTFRLARDFGDLHGQRELNNVWLSYHEMRAVVGFGGGIPFGDAGQNPTQPGKEPERRGLTWDVQVGYMFYRMLNYDREERLQNEEGAVYVGIGLNGRF